MPLNFFETANYKLKALTAKNPGHEIGTGFKELAKQIDETFVGYAEGTAAERPAAKIKGRVYYATDTKIYSVDTGTEWQELVSAGSIAVTGEVERASGTFTPSTTRWALVTLTLELLGAKNSVQVQAGATTVATLQLAGGSAGTATVPVTFLCPPGAAVSLSVGEGSVKMFSSHALL